MNQYHVVELNIEVDAHDVHAVMQAAYQVEADLLGVEEFFPLGRTAVEIAESANKFYGIWQEGRLLAVCEMERMPDQVMLIAATVVHPDAFRQGLASRLLAHVLAVYAGERIAVSTAVDNVPAVGLYRKFGFVTDRYETLPDGLELIYLRLERP